jgi:hypothetical protein
MSKVNASKIFNINNINSGCFKLGENILAINWLNFIVLDVMYSDVTSEDECKWFYRNMIYSPETNAVLTLTLAALHLITLLQKAFLKMLTLCTLALLHHA